MWGKPTPTNMQNFSCTLASEQTTTVTDSRDGNTYKIAKLKDDQCWMTENLKIAGRTLTPTNSDVASTFVLPSSSNSDFRSSYYNTANVYVDSTYGGYYTWYAATASEGTQDKSSGDVSHSICPKGWRLPNKVEYENLAAAYGSDSSVIMQKLTSAPASFVMSGIFSSYYGKMMYQGEYGEGVYWSSTAYDKDIAYHFFLGTTMGDPAVYMEHQYSKTNGLPVRCVSRE